MTFDIAREQNKTRGRKVPDWLFQKAHIGVSKQMSKIFRMSKNIRIDGDIWVLFNKRGVDNHMEKSELGGSYMKHINSVKIKEKGQPLKSFDEIMDMCVNTFDSEGNLTSRNSETVGSKIHSYVPDETEENW